MKYFVISFAIMFIFAFSSCTQKEESVQTKFLGTWKLDKVETLNNSTGKWEYDTTFTGWTGYITYDGSGHMGVQITSKGYKDFNTNKNPDSLNIKELKDLVKFYQSNWVYFASYKIADNTIEHFRLSATEPKNWGTTLKRDFEFKGDTLILTAHEIVGGKKSRLFWEKLK
jgi:hypothetical protein